MKWDEESCLFLIEAFKHHRFLWDSTHPYYYSKVKRNDAWDLIADQLDVDIDEARRKMNNLLSLFRRERLKLGNNMDPDAKDTYESNWFAFENMKFLLDYDDPRNTLVAADPVVWDNEMCLALISSYEKQRILWDNRHVHYSFKNEKGKKEAWMGIANQMKMDVDEVRRKMNSLLASFRRERARTKAITGSEKGRKNVYVSKWFAFESMQFLLDRGERNAPNNIKMEVGDHEEEDEGLPTPEERWLQQTPEIMFTHLHRGGVAPRKLDPYPPVPQFSGTFGAPPPDDDVIQHQSEPEDNPYVTIHPPKRKRQIRQYKYDEPEMRIQPEEVFQTPKQPSKQTVDSSPDECATFGQYLACKLRRYSAKTRACVEHIINNTIFEADMGKYDESYPMNGSPSFSFAYNGNPNVNSRYGNCSSPFGENNPTLVTKVPTTNTAD